MLKKKSILVITIIMISMVLFSSTVYASSNISVTYNGTPIKFDTQPIMKNGRVLVPLRAIGETLGVNFEWVQETKSVFYYNNSGVGYKLYIDNPKVEIKKGQGVPDEHITIDMSPTLINGRTYVPVRFIAESFGIDVNWNDKTQTVIIKDKDVKIQEEYDNKIYTIYAVEGTGKYAGWNQLKGYPGENLKKIFFKFSNEDGISKTEYKHEYIGKYDFSKSVTWVDSLGFVHINTIDELFRIQTGLGQDAIDKMLKVYGHMYYEWYEANTMLYYNYVEKYLIAKGEIEPKSLFPSKNPYDYLQDKDVVSKLYNNRAKIDFYDKTYEVYSISSDDGWRQLKGFYGEDYFDLFFYINRDAQKNIVYIKYDTVLKDTYDFNKDISWIGLDYKTCKSKLDVYNAINYNLNIGDTRIIEYYTDYSKETKPLDIVSESDNVLYEAFYYLHNEQYKFFVEEYLTQIGLNLDLPSENKDYLYLEELIPRKLSEDEILMLINNFVFLRSEKMYDSLGREANLNNFIMLKGKKLSEWGEISSIQALKEKDYEQYKLELEYISEDNLYKKYRVSFAFDPHRDDTTRMKADIIYYVDNDLQKYKLGYIPIKPYPSDVFNANGIRIVFKNNKAYLNKADLEEKGIPLIKK